MTSRRPEIFWRLTMKKTNFGRAVALVLALLMSVSAFVFVAGAATSGKLTATVDVDYDADAKTGTAYVKIIENTGIAGAKLVLEIPDCVTITGGYANSGWGSAISNLSSGTNLDNLERVTWFIGQANDTYKTGTVLTVNFTVSGEAAGTFKLTAGEICDEMGALLAFSGTSYEFPAAPKSDDNKTDDDTTEDNKGTTTDDKVVTSEVVSFKRNAKNIKYMAGYSDGTFKPTQDATRYEVINALYALVDIDIAAKESGFKDVNTKNAKIVDIFTTAGIINGYTDGTFRGDKTITRAEFCKIVCTILGLNTESVRDAGFTDISKHWAKNYINACAKAGYVQGKGNGRFAPDANITRAELVTMINRITSAKDGTSCSYDDVSANAWYFGAVAAAAK